jgi:hypothetical protein
VLRRCFSISEDTTASTAPVCFSMRGGKLKGTGESLALLAPDNDIRAKSGITLGGASVGEDGSWTGNWNPLPVGSVSQDGMVSVTIPPSSALVLRLPLAARK